MSHIRPALVLLVVFTLLTGLIYPLGLTVLAQSFFPAAANGSLITKDGNVVGSALIGQNFTAEKYFHGRPSGAGAAGYEAASSSGSNLAPSSKALYDAIKERAEKLGAGPQPADLVTASGSGLDPDISPAAAMVQIARVAQARGLGEDKVRDLVNRSILARELGMLGEPRVNVLNLNLALDTLTP